MRVEVEALVARYGRRTALDGVGFEVAPGTVFALLGRNGAGKSTLVKCLLGQRRPDGGRIRLDGLDPWRHRARLMARLGATPETPDAPPALPLDEIERCVAPLYSRWDRATFRARLERFGIDRRRRFGELSRGQKAIAQLALALAPAPELLILDDPTLGLDAVARRYFYEELVVELADRGTTVLLATHDLDGAERVATHVGVLDRGRLRAYGLLEELRDAAGPGSPNLEEIFVSLVGEERRAS